MARLNLDDFQPEGHELVFRGVEYRLPGAVPVESVLRAVQIDADLNEIFQIENDDDELMRRFTAANVEMYELVMDLIRDANPDLAIGGYTDEQRRRFRAATGKQKVTDEMLETAGVQKTPGLRLTVDDCSRVMALVAGGRPGQLIAEAITDQLSPEGELVQGEEGADGFPPTELAVAAHGAQKVPRSRKRSPSRSSK